MALETLFMRCLLPMILALSMGGPWLWADQTASSQSVARATQPTLSPETNRQSLAELRKLLAERYAPREDVAWLGDDLPAEQAQAMETAGSAEEFAAQAARLLAPARDMWIRFEAGARSFAVFRRRVAANYNPRGLAALLPGLTWQGDRVATARLDENLGYILITSWSRERPETLDPAFAALERMTPLHGLIIDVRPNAGSEDYSLAGEFAGCFLDEARTYARSQARVQTPAPGWAEPVELSVKPSVQRPKFRGEVVVLCGPANSGSTEAFLLMMKQVPAARLVGEATYGSSGLVENFTLPNGVRLQLPVARLMEPHGWIVDGAGIEPDVRVEARPEVFLKGDPVLEKARELLRGP